MLEIQDILDQIDKKTDREVKNHQNLEDVITFNENLLIEFRNQKKVIGQFVEVCQSLGTGLFHIRMDYLCVISFNLVLSI